MEKIAEEIEKVITLDLPKRRVIYHLYEAARKLTRGPLTLRAAQLIQERVEDKSNVIIVTGFPQSKGGLQETDGPLGAIALARVIKEFKNAKIYLVGEENALKVLEACAKILGLNYEKDLNLIPFTTEESKAKEEASKIISELQPSLIISIEKVGKNVKGRYHSMKGINLSNWVAKVDILFEMAKDKNILTLGIGDGGNEIGMGNIYDTVLEWVPNAKKCLCECEAGIASVTKCDLLVVSSISNWGAYGIEALLCLLFHEPEFMHDGYMEDKMLEASIEAGAIDGFSHKPIKAIDGIESKVNSSVVDIIKALIS